MTLLLPVVAQLVVTKSVLARRWVLYVQTLAFYHEIDVLMKVMSMKQNSLLATLLRSEYSLSRERSKRGSLGLEAQAVSESGRFNPSM